jgi:heptosyltransferase III
VPPDGRRRILVVRVGALGDLILLRGVVAMLRRDGAFVTLLAPTRPGSAIVNPDDGGLAQKLVPWESAELARALADDSAAALRILVGTFDLALCYSRDADLAQRLAALADRLVVHDPAPPPEIHAAAWLMQPVATLGLAPGTAATIVPTTEEARAAAIWRERLPDGFLTIHPGSGSARKNWPVDRYAALARRLARDRPWLLSLGPADEAAEHLACEPNAVVTRDLPPRALGALLARAGLYVGNDSGVSHLAAAVGTPTVALFGPTSPAVWAPVGPRVRIVRATGQRMESIAVDEVERAVEKLKQRA